MSKKNKGPNQEDGKSSPKGPGSDSKTPGFSHGPVASLDLERARKELEKNRIEFRVEKGELFTIDNGDTTIRNNAIKVVNSFKRKAS